MGITTAMCTSFKQELLGGIHDLDTDSIKLALIKPSNSGTYGAATTVTAVAGDLTIEFPAVGASTTIIRIA